MTDLLTTIHAVLADPAALRWMFVGSALMFVAVLIVIPIVVARLPATYFLGPGRSGIPWFRRHPIVWIPLLVLKNALALTCVIVGVLMLVLVALVVSVRLLPLKAWIEVFNGWVAELGVFGLVVFAIVK